MKKIRMKMPTSLGCTWSSTADVYIVCVKIARTWQHLQWLNIHAVNLYRTYISIQYYGDEENCGSHWDLVTRFKEADPLMV